MKLVVGLGNPGARYVGTRHNAGFEVVDRLFDLSGAQGKEKFKGIFAKGNVHGHGVGLLMPTTYMNRSGDSVRLAMDFFNLDKPTAELKIKETPFNEEEEKKQKQKEKK